MGETQKGVDNGALAISEQGYSLNKTRYQIYKTIDWNENVFRDGSATSPLIIGSNFGCRLYFIEKFMMEVGEGGEAFSEETTKSGRMKRLAMSAYLPQMNSFLASYSSSKIYSPYVELFFQVCLSKFELLPGDFTGNPDFYNPVLKMKEGAFLNLLISDISVSMLQRPFRRKLYSREELIRAGRSSAVRCLNALFKISATLFVVRIDFGFRATNPAMVHAVGMAEARGHFARYFNNRRSKKLYANLKGYIWRLEYGDQKGYRYHVFFLFDGLKSYDNELLVHELGADWIKVTDNVGIYQDCSVHEQSYKRLGVGLVSIGDEAKRQEIVGVLEYMHEEDQTLRRKHPSKVHGWGMGHVRKRTAKINAEILQ